MQHLTGGGPGREQRVIAEDLPIAVRSALLAFVDRSCQAGRHVRVVVRDRLSGHASVLRSTRDGLGGHRAERRVRAVVGLARGFSPRWPWAATWLLHGRRCQPAPSIPHAYPRRAGGVCVRPPLMPPSTATWRDGPTWCSSRMAGARWPPPRDDRDDPAADAGGRTVRPSPAALGARPGRGRHGGRLPTPRRVAQLAEPGPADDIGRSASLSEPGASERLARLVAHPIPTGPQLLSGPRGPPTPVARARASRACGTRSRSSGRPMWAAGTGHHNRLTSTHRAAATKPDVDDKGTSRAVEGTRYPNLAGEPYRAAPVVPSALQAESEHGFIDASQWSTSGRPGWRGEHCCPVDQRPRCGGGVRSAQSVEVGRSLSGGRPPDRVRGDAQRLVKPAVQGEQRCDGSGPTYRLHPRPERSVG